MGDSNPNPPPKKSERSYATLATVTPLIYHSFKAGDVILGRYTVGGELGRGGMGVVYRCHDQVGDIDVALKALPPEISHNEYEMESIRENFKLVSGLVHQNIAQIRTLEREPASGDYYLVMECVVGEDLRKWARGGAGGKRSLGELLPLFHQIAAALDFADTLRIVHRDVKPSNIMVTAGGVAKVLDFGIAAQIQSGMSRASRVLHSVSGTAPYMAPEQWEGKYQDGKSDQYSLAVVVYELLAGRLPFEGMDSTVLHSAVLHSTPQRPEGMSRAIWAALSRGLAKKRDHRFNTCTEFINALDTTASARFLATSHVPPSRRKARSVRFAVAAVIAAAAIAGVWWKVVKPMLAESEHQHAARIQQAKMDMERQEMIAALTSEIENLLQHDDLKTACEKIAELEKVGTAENVAKDLRFRCESKAGEHDIIKRYAETSLVYEKTRKIDGGQTIGKKIDEMEIAWREAEGARTQKSWGLAVKSFDRVKILAADIQKMDKDRTAALVARGSSDNVRSQAERVNAAVAATHLWSRAVQLNDQANKAYEAADFAQASTCWENSAKDFQSSEVQAKTQQGFDKPPTNHSATLAATDTPPVNKSGSAHENTAGMGIRPAGFPGPAETQDVHTRILRDEPKKDPPPSLKIVAEAAGRAVEATVWDGKKNWPTPATLELEMNGSCAFSVTYAGGNKRWKPATISMRADWHGMQTNHVILEEQKFPDFGFAWDNSLEMKFIPVNGLSNVLFGIWDVRVKDHRAFADATGSQWEKPPFSQTDNDPAVMVSWDDAKAFCEWITKKEHNEGKLDRNQLYRLPTDAEWSVAVGLPTESGSSPKDKNGRITGVYPWGAQWPPSEGAGNYAGSLSVDKFEKTSPVGSFAANRHGLFDMGGNVWQWCEDKYDDFNAWRVLRGGSWHYDDSQDLLSSGRDHNFPVCRSGYIGYRVVLSTSP